MPGSATTVKVTWADGSVETYTVPDDTTIVKGDLVVKFTGKLGSEAAHAIEITRSQTKKIEYGV